jgi:hypothetical protein
MRLIFSLAILLSMLRCAAAGYSIVGLELGMTVDEIKQRLTGFAWGEGKHREQVIRRFFAAKHWELVVVDFLDERAVLITRVLAFENDDRPNRIQLIEDLKAKYGNPNGPRLYKRASSLSWRITQTNRNESNDCFGDVEGIDLPSNVAAAYDERAVANPRTNAFTAGFFEGCGRTLEAHIYSNGELVSLFSTTAIDHEPLSNWRRAMAEDAARKQKAINDVAKKNRPPL